MQNYLDNALSNITKGIWLGFGLVFGVKLAIYSSNLFRVLSSI